MSRPIEDLFDTLLRYIESRIDLFKIQTRDRIEQAIVTAIYFAIVAGAGLVILILLVIMAGTYLNHLLDSSYLGFLILLGFFAVFLAGIVLQKAKILLLLRAAIGKIVQESKDRDGGNAPDDMGP
jgi:hypothetical protein